MQPSSLDSPLAPFFVLALGLLFFQCSNEGFERLVKQLSESITHPLGKYAEYLLTGFFFAGTGDVLKVQKMMQVCSMENKQKEMEEVKEKKEGDKTKEESSTCPPAAAALLSIPMIAFAENLGNEMCMRTMEHVLQYCNVKLRRIVPLCIGLLHVSHPKLQAIDLLSKLSHDSDQETASCAIFCMGLIGAGTNHAKIANLLRQLAGYYSREPNLLFMVRIAQGLLYAAKGLVTLSPLQSDRFLINPVSFGCIMVLLTTITNGKELFFTHNMHYLLYYVCCAMTPRMLICLDSDNDMKPIGISVRVGAAVDVTGQVGNPKKITGFQTHTTPVLLQQGERAELATDEYIAFTNVMEGVVLVKRNPNSTKAMDA